MKNKNFVKHNRLESIKRANRSKYFDYKYLYDSNNHLNKMMLTFTYKDDDPYYKMHIINEIKNYFALLVRNTRSDIKYYSNIELGEDFNNPHLHIQIFYNDYNQIMLIRDKIIALFGLFSEYCEITLPKYDNVAYDYVIKDYNNKQSDEKLLLIDDYKRHYRDKLKNNIRFTSLSRDKYTKKVYKRAYNNGIVKCNVDELIDCEVINEDIKIIDNVLIYYFELIVFMKMRELIPYKNKKVFDLNNDEMIDKIQYSKLNEYWISGFI